MQERGRLFHTQPPKTEVVFSPDMVERVGGNWRPLFFVREQQCPSTKLGLDPTPKFNARNAIRTLLTNLTTEEIAVWPTMVAASDGGTDYHGVFVQADVELEMIKKIQEKAERHLKELQKPLEDEHAQGSLLDCWPEVHFFDQEAA